MRVLAFDIGIKNLAFCILDDRTVLALENINLLPTPPVTRCVACGVKASFQVQEFYCRRHVPKTHPIRQGLTPSASHTALKAVLQELGVCPLPRTKAACWAELANRIAIPIAQAKGENASKVSLDVIHDALRTMIATKWSNFEGCTHVLLENQPVFKNPHMKSVQILLYASLREAFLSRGLAPIFQFIHAKKKVQDAPKGDAGYAERKSKSEDRLIELFDSGQVQGAEWYDAWREAGKKSDMADALCMAVDSL